MFTVKKIISLIACLALVFSCVGVCFADTATSWLSPGIDLSTYKDNCFFLRYEFSDFQSLLNDDTIYLFNGIYLVKNNSNTFHFDYNGAVSQTYSFNGSYLYFYISTFVGLLPSSSNFNFSQTAAGQSGTQVVYFPNDSNHYITPSMLGITSGNSFEYSSTATGEVLDFSVPAGYAFVLEGEFDIVERSYYINNSWNFRQSDNNRVNGSLDRKISSSNIVDAFSPDRLKPTSSLIQWEALNPNLFGTASNYEFYDGDTLNVFSGESFIISYPTLYGYGSSNSVLLYNNASDMICSVYILYSVRPSMRWVALESLSEYSSSGIYSTYSVFRPDVADVDGSSSSGSGGTVITPESNLPTDGGNHGQPPVDEDQSFFGVISRLVNSISKLFIDAVHGIESLLNSGSSFLQTVSTMFDWLPSGVSSVLLSGFIVLFIVGVIKTLWR